MSHTVPYCVLTSAVRDSGSGEGVGTHAHAHTHTHNTHVHTHTHAHTHTYTHMYASTHNEQHICKGLSGCSCSVSQS